MGYLVWHSEELATYYHNMKTAIANAQRENKLVTEVNPLGDPRILFVEDLADGLLGDEVLGATNPFVVAAKRVIREEKKTSFEHPYFDPKRNQQIQRTIFPSGRRPKPTRRQLSTMLRRSTTKLAPQQ